MHSRLEDYGRLLEHQPLACLDWHHRGTFPGVRKVKSVVFDLQRFANMKLSSPLSDEEDDYFQKAILLNSVRITSK